MRIKLMREGAVPPRYATSDSAGADLFALIGDAKQVAPGQRWRFYTGIAIELDRDQVGIVTGRSGLFMDEGIFVAPGTIDSDYRGELAVQLVNVGRDPVTILPGQRIAQLVVTPVCRPTFDVVDELNHTERGASGFGSSGR